MASLEQGGFPCVDLSNELAKLHLRHMVGGRLPEPTPEHDAVPERLYRFEFPERPGALMAFVEALHPGWTISIFITGIRAPMWAALLWGCKSPLKSCRNGSGFWPICPSKAGGNQQSRLSAFPGLKQKRPLRCANGLNRALPSGPTRGDPLPQKALPELGGIERAGRL